MHRLNSEFDRVVCINLSSRNDKRQIMESKFSDHGIDVSWHTAVTYGFAGNVVNSIVNSKCGSFNSAQPNEFGCALSHYSVIKRALEDGVERLFVFEDDVKFHNNFDKRFDRAMDTLPTDWDMIMLYSFMYNIMPQNIRVSPHWIRSYKAWSLMAYGMNRRVMSEYIKMQDAFFTISDAVTYKMQESGMFNIYSSVPTMCIPDASFDSNIRYAKNYEATPTILNLGIDTSEYK